MSYPPFICERCARSPEHCVIVVDRADYPLMTVQMTPRWPGRLVLCEPCLRHYEQRELQRAKARKRARSRRRPSHAPSI